MTLAELVVLILKSSIAVLVFTVGLGTPARELTHLLREQGITAVTVVGLATDYCVLNTARDALKEGLLVSVDSSAVRAVDLEPGDGERALDELRSLGALVAP